MSKIKRDKFNADLVVAKEYKPKYILGRLNDGFSQVGRWSVQYIEWTDEGHFKSKHDEIKVGRSLILDNGWLTTIITEIVEQREGYIKFQTQNSTYELTEIQASKVN